MARRRVRGRAGWNVLGVGALIVVGVLFAVVVSIAGQRPYDAPLEEQPTQEQKSVEGVEAPIGYPEDVAAPEPPEDARLFEATRNGSGP